MSKVRTTQFDAADYLDTPEIIASYLAEALESKDPMLITKAIGTVARARSVGGIVEDKLD